MCEESWIKLAVKLTMTKKSLESAEFEGVGMVKDEGLYAQTLYTYFWNWSSSAHLCLTLSLVSLSLMISHQLGVASLILVLSSLNSLMLTWFSSSSLYPFLWLHSSSARYQWLSHTSKHGWAHPGGFHMLKILQPI